MLKRLSPRHRLKNQFSKQDFNYSHLDHKKVWSHQLFTTTLSCGNMVLPYSIQRYEKDVKSKPQMLIDVLNELPISEKQVYGLSDSWFPSEKVINAHLKKGYHYISALKTNRIIYPQGIHIQIQQFAQHIRKEDCHLVIVKKSKYWVYRYEGKLNGVDNAVVLMCYKEDQFKVDGALHAFLCTDTELDSQTILKYYSRRWPIEIFFRQTKGNLGLNGYQVRSTKAIDRLLLLIALTYTYCVIIENTNNSFSKGINICRNNNKKEQIQVVYNCAKDGVPIENVFKIMKVA